MKRLVVTFLTIVCSFSLSFAQSEDAYTVQVDTSRANSVLFRISHLGIGEELCYNEYLEKK